MASVGLSGVQAIVTAKSGFDAIASANGASQANSLNNLLSLGTTAFQEGLVEGTAGKVAAAWLSDIQNIINTLTAVKSTYNDAVSAVQAIGNIRG